MIRRVHPLLACLGCLALLFASFASCSDLRAQGVPHRLEFADRVRLVESGDGSPRPYFRMQLNIVDDQGTPVSVPLPKDLQQSVEVIENNRSYRPAHIQYREASQSSSGNDTPNRYALLLIDVSGSMLEKTSSGGSEPEAHTKYDDAKSAALRFLSGFESGKDHVAVVPFESHQVEERIRSATFAESVEAARDQIDKLPKPKANYNTALFSAVVAALNVLESKKGADPLALVILVVLTDGQNQVGSRDDPGLLDGPRDLERVAEKVIATGIQVMTVGFGDDAVALGRKGAFDAAALRRLAWPSERNFRAAADAQDLGKLFGVARKLQLDRLQLTLATGWMDRSQLAGQDLRFQVRLKLGNDQIESPWIQLRTPQVSAPPFEGTLDAREVQDILQTATPETREGQESYRVAILRRLAIFGGLGVVLVLFWFVFPLFFWRAKTPAPRPASVLSQAPKVTKGPLPGPVETVFPSRNPDETLPAQTIISVFPSQSPPMKKRANPDDTIVDPRGLETRLDDKPRNLSTPENPNKK